MAAAIPPAVVIAAGRTAIGTARKGALANVEASELAKPVGAARSSHQLVADVARLDRHREAGMHAGDEIEIPSTQNEVGGAVPSFSKLAR